jgi:hypothetical protein
MVEDFMDSSALPCHWLIATTKPTQAPMPLVFQGNCTAFIGRIRCMVARLRKSIEHTEQVKLVQRVRAFYPDTIIASIPNGGDRTASERVRLHHEGVLAGMPDLCVLEAKNGFHGLFVEMKTATGQQSKEQKALQLQLNNRGYLCTVARSAAEGFEIIKGYLNGECKHTV